MTPQTGLCDDCGGLDDPRRRCYYRGQIVTKGRGPRPVVCGDCGTVIEGVPGVFSHLYRWITGRWPWQSGDDDG